MTTIHNFDRVSSNTSLYRLIHNTARLINNSGVCKRRTKMSEVSRLLTTLTITTDADERNYQQQSSECNCELHSVTNTVAHILAFITVIIIIIIILLMKKRSEATQTLRAGCSKADPQTHKQTGAITIHCAA